MEKIIIDKSVLDYFDNLIYRLFEDEYFSYLEISLEYVQRILDFILDDLPTKPPKKSPYNLIQYGTFYTFYKANETTTWYIFFEKKNNIYVIRKLLNNHQPETRFLNL